MKIPRLKVVPKPKPDLSFPPPFTEQAKYVELADKFLASEESQSTDEKIHAIEAESSENGSKVIRKLA